MYTVNGRALRISSIQWELSVQIHRSLKVATQVDMVVEKAYGMLAFIRRGVEHWNCKIMLQLYKTLVRLHLEYCVQFRSSHCQNDVDALERMHKRFTRCCQLWRIRTVKKG